MLSFLSTGSARDDVPDWWSGGLQPGHLVQLEVYGDKLAGRLLDATGDTVRISIPVAEQTSGLRLSTAHGTAVISLGGGAARVPVSCWASGDVVRLQVIGPVQFVQRREHARFTVRLPVSLGWRKTGEKDWNHAHSDTVDISLGGLRVAPATTVWPGSGVTVQVMLELPDGPCELQAVVVGTAPDYGLRLRFTAVAPAALERLRRLTT